MTEHTHGAHCADVLAALEGLIHALTEGTMDDEDGAFATAELAITKARGG